MNMYQDDNHTLNTCGKLLNSALRVYMFYTKVSAYQRLLLLPARRPFVYRHVNKSIFLNKNNKLLYTLCVKENN